MPISNIVTYHRPPDLVTALRLLREGEGRAVPLAGGTSLAGIPPREVEEVVDLRELDLATIRKGATGEILLGATVTLDALTRDEGVQGYAEGIVATAARYAAGSVIRTRATVGGTLVARPGSDFAAVLLAVGADVTLHGDREERLPLDALWGRLDRAREERSALLLTEVHLPALAEEATLRLERVARTPMDQPILSVAALVSPEKARAAVAGLSERPLLLLDGPESASERWEEAVQRAEAVEVRDDHLASATYRRAMLAVLLRRVLASES